MGDSISRCWQELKDFIHQHYKLKEVYIKGRLALEIKKKEKETDHG